MNVNEELRKQHAESVAVNLEMLAYQIRDGRVKVLRVENTRVDPFGIAHENHSTRRIVVEYESP